MSDAANGLDTPRLQWRARRQGLGVEVSIATPRPLPSLTFEAVDLLASGNDIRVGPGRQRLSGACADLAPAAAVLAFCGFIAGQPEDQPVIFTLAVSLATLPRPEALSPDRSVESFALAPGPGVRIRHLNPVADGAAIWPSLTATYLAQTDAGVLGLAFSTPHIDAAPEFAAAFDRMAASVELAYR